MSIGSSATKTLPSGAVQTTDGCRMSGACATNFICHPGRASGNSALRISSAQETSATALAINRMMEWLPDMGDANSWCAGSVVVSRACHAPRLLARAFKLRSNCAGILKGLVATLSNVIRESQSVSSQSPWSNDKAVRRFSHRTALNSDFLYPTPLPSDERRLGLLLFAVGLCFIERGLRSGQTRHGHAERRATHIT